MTHSRAFWLSPPTSIVSVGLIRSLSKIARAPGAKPILFIIVSFEGESITFFLIAFKRTSILRSKLASLTVVIGLEELDPDDGELVEDEEEMDELELEDEDEGTLELEDEGDEEDGLEELEEELELELEELKELDELVLVLLDEELDSLELEELEPVELLDKELLDILELDIDDEPDPVVDPLPLLSGGLTKSLPLPLRMSFTLPGFEVSIEELDDEPDELEEDPEELEDELLLGVGFDEPDEELDEALVELVEEEEFSWVPVTLLPSSFSFSTLDSPFTSFLSLVAVLFLLLSNFSLASLYSFSLFSAFSVTFSSSFLAEVNFSSKAGF